MAAGEEGQGWEELRPGEPVLIWDLCAVDGDMAWTVGKDGLGMVKAYRTTDGGLSWEGFPASPDPAGNYEYLRIQAWSEREAWVYGYGRQQYGMFIRRTLDGGSSWETVCSREGKYPLDVEILDQDRLWLVGVETVVVPGSDPGGGRTFINGFVERSWDGGATWTRQFDYPFVEYMGPHDRTANYFPYSFDLEAVDSTTAWVGIYNRLLKTEDGGLNWTPQLEAPGPVTLRVSAVGSDTAWLAWGREIKRTGDGGAVWVNTHSASAGYLAVDVAGMDAHACWALEAELVEVGGTYPPFRVLAHGKVLKTHDGGETWPLQDLPVDAALGTVQAVDACRAWAADTHFSSPVPTGSDTVLRTSDGGDSRPDLLSLAPTSGQAGSEVIISGCDFGDAQGGSYVSFGGTQAAAYERWTDGQVVVRVPEGVVGEVLVTVHTLGGVSNPVTFTGREVLSVVSARPDHAFQHTIALSIALEGTGFVPGARARLERNDAVIEAVSCTVESNSKMGAAFSLLGVEPGAYHVVVSCPDGREARLENGFTVVSPCGQGSGFFLPVLGLSLGCLCLAGLRRRGNR